MAQLLDFCSKCGARQLRDVKKKLQDLFATRADLEENVCWICRKVIDRRRERKKKAAEESTVTLELKTEPTDVPVGQETLQAITNLESVSVPAETVTLQANRNLESDDDDDFAEPLEANNDEDSEGPPEVKKEIIETEVVDERRPTVDADTDCLKSGKQDENHDKNNKNKRSKSGDSAVKTKKDVTEKKAVFVSRRTTRLRTGATKDKTVRSFDKQMYGIESDDDSDDDDSDASDQAWDPESEESDKNIKKRKKDKTVDVEENVLENRDKVWDPESEESNNKNVKKRKKEKTVDVEEKVPNTAADMDLLLASVYNKPEDAVKETDPDAPSSSMNEDRGPTRAYLELKTLRPEVLEVMGRIEDEEIPYKCKFCKQKPYRAAVHLLKHVAEKHTGTEPITKPFLCKTSGKYFERNREWYRHTKEKPYKCKHSGCNDHFISKRDLQNHHMGHDGARPFSCEQCDSSFKTKYSLDNHVKAVHDQIKDQICRFCEQTFTSSGNLKKHEQGHTNYRPFKCTRCGKGYISKAALQDHLMDHTGERPFVCETCGFRTKNKHNLKIHAEVHVASTDTPWKCDLCGKQYKSKRLLYAHSKVHNKTFKCRFCDKMFNYKVTCDQHEKGHPEWSGERKFICKVCGRDCHAKAKLAEHMRSHTKEKPFHCTYCSYSASLKRNLDTHMRRHTGDEPYSCPTCDKRFMYYQPCKDHQKVCSHSAGTSSKSSNAQAGTCSISNSGQVKVKSEIKTEITEALLSIAESESASEQGAFSSIPYIVKQDYMNL